MHADIAQSNGGSTVSSISRKTVAWASAAVLAVGGCTAGIVLAVQRRGEPTQPPGQRRGHPAAPLPLRVVSISPA